MKNKNKEIYTEEQVKRVLHGIGIDIEKETGAEYLIYCPFHNNSRTPAGEINKYNGVLFCFSCQKVADLQETVMQVSGRTYFEALRYIKGKEKESDIAAVINKTLYVKPDFVQFDELLIKRLNIQALESPRAMRYYEGRKITKESISKFSLGYSEKQDYVTIPVHSPDGMCIGFVGRSIEGKDFKNTPGLPKSKVLFNLHRIKSYDTVYVVESSFDAIRLDQLNFPAVATLGANVSVSQTDLLKKYFNDIVLIADNDEAGKTMSEKLVERLGSQITIINIDKKYKDIGDMDDESIKKLEYRFDNSIISMLQ